MASYVWKDGVLSVTLVDAEGVEPDLVFDPMACNQSVRDAAMRFGFQVALRNATAGKMDEIDAKARPDLLAKAKVFVGGVWKEATEGKAEVKLSEEERAQVIVEVLLRWKKAKGDKRPDAEILEAFQAIGEVKRKEVLASLAKLIDMALKQRLKDKKAAAKVTDDDSMKF